MKNRTAYSAPFPYFGGKGVVAPLVWERFGSPRVYIEPFFGSGAVLLAAAGWEHRQEIVNDRDGHVTNFWRSIKYAAPSVVEIIRSTPPDECELEARNSWLKKNYDDLSAKLRADHTYHHPEMAAMWCWGLPQWIGDGWGDPTKKQARGIPSVGKGVHALNLRNNTEEKLRGLARRLSSVTICNGDWERVVSHSFLKDRITAVFLDPPYAVSADLYTGNAEDKLLERVEAFIASATDNRDIRVAVCGYDGTMKIPSSWESMPWTSPGGLNNHSKTNTNRFKECVWFSPSCLKPAAGGFSL